MSFHLTAFVVLLNDNHSLFATLQKTDGSWTESEFDLDTCIGNDDGHFSWSGNNFSHSARNVELSEEGEEMTPMIHAELKNMNGDWIVAKIDLSERISNLDGRLCFCETPQPVV